MKPNDITSKFVGAARDAFKTTSGEVEERNANVSKRDGYIYGNTLDRALKIPIGHDFTPVNWLRRTVEIHKNMFMSRGFQMVSTYDSEDVNSASDPQDRGRLEIENKKKKEFAEQRQKTIEAIIQDNGGYATWGTIAENCSAVGDSCIKAWYDKDEKKYVVSEIEAIENVYVLWSKDDFREWDAIAYVYQVSKQTAMDYYNAPADVVTSPLGAPLEVLSQNENQVSNQPMVTIMEVTGKIPGWGSENGRLKTVKPGNENVLNATIVGQTVTQLIDDEDKIPKYYILPNKKQRRRAWSMSDVSDAAISINLTYIETLSDWRTVSSKVNFPKYKAYGFGPDSQLPKSQPRKVQAIPMAEGQDMQLLNQGDANQIDFRNQMDELKEQFVRETGISRVLFDDPSVTFNSNQALLTSMKPTSDIAESKKQLWAPIMVEIFTDALETLARVEPDTYGDLVNDDDNWTLKVMWPSVMQKEDPVFQNMLLNRFNTGTMSLQSYLEQQGETKEEIDRIRDEMSDPLTAGVLGKQLPLLAQSIINAATADIQAWFQSQLPQNQPEAPALPQGSAPQITGGPAASAEGTGIVSQPGSGATPVSAGGAVAQVAQNNGA